MYRLRFSAALVICVACHQPALAADPILVEFGWSQPNPVTLPADYIALVESNSWDPFANNTATAYPTTQFAVSGAVFFWNQNCADGSACGVGFHNGGQEPTQPSSQFNLDQVLGGPNRLWADGWEGNPQPFPNHSGTWHATTYVPQLGGPNQALKGYIITAVEREVTATTQNIRVYGYTDPLPEPTSAMLVVLAGIMHFSRRFRGSGY